MFEHINIFIYFLCYWHLYFSRLYSQTLSIEKFATKSFNLRGSMLVQESIKGVNTAFTKKFNSNCYKFTIMIVSLKFDRIWAFCCNPRFSPIALSKEATKFGWTRRGLLLTHTENLIRAQAGWLLLCTQHESEKHLIPSYTHTDWYLCTVVFFFHVNVCGFGFSLVFLLNAQPLSLIKLSN